MDTGNTEALKNIAALNAIMATLPKTIGSINELIALTEQNLHGTVEIGTEYNKVLAANATLNDKIASLTRTGKAKQIQIELNALKELSAKVLAVRKAGSERDIAIATAEYDSRRSALEKEAQVALRAGEAFGITATELGRISGILAEINPLASKAATHFDKWSDKLGKMGMVLPQSMQSVKKLSDALGTNLKFGAIASGGFVLELVKQLFSFAQDSTQNFNVMIKTGGLMNNSLATSALMAAQMQNSWVSFADSMKALTSITDEYAVMLNTTGVSVDKAAGITKVNEQALANANMEMSAFAARLALMAPMFGMSADTMGKAMGAVISRFHVPSDFKALNQTLDAFTKLSQGTGIQMSQWLDLFSDVGNTLRYVNVPLESVIGRFAQLTLNMQATASESGKFWRELQPGEMISMMRSITDVWQKTTSEMYLALRPGAVPTTMAGYAEGIKEFYKAEPVEMMKMMADRYLETLQKTPGVSREAAELFAAKMPGFADMGRMAPRVIELLGSMTQKQIESSGMGKDMNVLLEELGRRFPDQKDNIDAFRIAQVGTQEPLQVISRTLIQMFRFLVSSSVGLKLGTGAAKAADEAVRNLETNVLTRMPGMKRSLSNTALAGSRRGL